MSLGSGKVCLVVINQEVQSPWISQEEIQEEQKILGHSFKVSACLRISHSNQQFIVP